jgi:hypothetical protein
VLVRFFLFWNCHSFRFSTLSRTSTHRCLSLPIVRTLSSAPSTIFLLPSAHSISLPWPLPKLLTIFKYDITVLVCDLAPTSDNTRADDHHFGDRTATAERVESSVRHYPFTYLLIHSSYLLIKANRVGERPLLSTRSSRLSHPL